MTPHTRMMELSRSLSRPVYELGACNSTRFWQWQSRHVYGRRTQARAVIPPPYEHAAAGCRPARARTLRSPRRGACARPGARRTRAPRPGRWPTRTRPGACPGGQSPRPGTPRPPPPACARRPGGPRAGAPSLLIAQGATQCAHDAEITTTTTLTERNKELSFFILQQRGRGRQETDGSPRSEPSFFRSTGDAAGRDPGRTRVAMQQRMASLGTAAAAPRAGHSLHVPAAVVGCMLLFLPWARPAPRAPARWAARRRSGSAAATCGWRGGCSSGRSACQGGCVSRGGVRACTRAWRLRHKPRSRM